MLAWAMARRVLGAVIVMAVGAASARADIVQLTYQVTASNFGNTWGVPPPPLTSNWVSGTFTFTIDTSVYQTELVPDSVVGLDITKSTGAVIDFDETNTGVNTAVNVGPSCIDLTIGGTTSTVAGMVGLSDDFRFKVRVSETDFQVKSISEYFYFVTTDDSFYRAQNMTVTLLQASSQYCQAGTSASGCQATLASAGTASATANLGFVVTASTVEGNKDGFFFFGTNGRQASPWGNGSSFQCVVPPVKRALLQPGTGTNGQCDGILSQDFNRLWSAMPAKNPGAGATVQAQLWYRDPLNTSNQTTSLSDAIEFGVGP